MSPTPSTTASSIIASAPLGAIIRFSDGLPRPPARFTRKLRDWESRNATGRLTEKNTGRDGREDDFTLHLGNFGSDGVVILSVSKVFTSASRLTFTVDRVPQPGEALVITEFRGRQELRHLAANEAAANAWLETHRYSNARFEVVPDPSLAMVAA